MVLLFLLYNSQCNEPYIFLSRRLKRIYFPYWWHLPFAALIIPLSTSLVSMLKTHDFNINIVNYQLTEWFNIIALSKVFYASDWRLYLEFHPLNSVIWYLAIIVQIYFFIASTLYFKNSMSTVLIVLDVFILFINKYTLF